MQTYHGDEPEDFAVMLEQMQVDLDMGREEIRPCKPFPKGASILAKQNGHVASSLEVGRLSIEFAREQLDKDQVQARTARYARNFEKGQIPCTILNCLVR